MDILAKLNEVFRQVFDDDDITVDRSSTAATVSGWDSVMHITLMMGIERAFKIRVNAGDAAGLKNVGELVDMIEKRTGA